MLGGGVDEKQRFFNIFGDICDEIAIESISASWPNFDVSSIKSNFDSTIYGNTDYHELLVCPFIFYSIAVNADGSVSACFSDWNHKLIAGNVSEQSLVDIWNGTYMNQLRISVLEGKRKQIDVCDDCGQMIYCALDNIDNSREILLERLRSVTSE